MHVIVRIVLIGIDTVVLKDTEAGCPEYLHQRAAQRLRFDAHRGQGLSVEVEHRRKMAVRNNQKSSSFVSRTIHQRRDQQPTTDECTLSRSGDELAKSAGGNGWHPYRQGVSVV